MRKPVRVVRDELRRFALSLPGGVEDHPWGETVVKVDGKVFVFLGSGDDAFGLSVKLPENGLAALSFPFASPTRYGLGRSGWVTARFEARDPVPVGLLREWIAESYRAVAPRRRREALAAALPARAAPPSSRRSRR